MAIYHLSMKPIARSSGRSAVAASAYRSGQDLLNERDGVRHDFTHRGGVVHAEIVLPKNVAHAAWACDRSNLWNTAEKAEKRKDARVAREVEVSLPHELTPEERLALTRDFAQAIAERFGVAVDFAIHQPHTSNSQGDERNHHAHLLMTTRRVEKGGLGEKSMLEWENKKLQAQDLPTTHDQLRMLRVDWEEHVNMHLAHAKLDLRVDHRSHAARGLSIEPTQYVGVHATQMQRRGLEVSRVRLEPEAAWHNAQAIQKNPEEVLSMITNEKSVFDRHDIARALHRMVDDPAAFQSALIRVMASKALVELQPEQKNDQGVIEPARYSTKEMIAIERDMARATDRLQAREGAGVPLAHVNAAISNRPALSVEQREAIRHITQDTHIAAVVGLAGAGKSTMLAAAREAWEVSGYRVHGAALAGKAAEGLEQASAIPSRTLASWQMSWERGFDTLGKKDVLVIDEAGMVGSRQLAKFISEIDRVGAKVVLVGDPEQLQPIGAGAAFRAVAERTGFASLEGVRRQSEGWQQTASKDFGKHRTVQGLAAYQGHGAIRLENHGQAARAAIVEEVLEDRAQRPEGSRLVMAHRRVDVAALNQDIRAAHQARGELTDEVTFQTRDGQRRFAEGDRILFLQNDRALGVKNGVMGTVESANKDLFKGQLNIRLDNAKGEGQGPAVMVDLAVYNAVDHGYATTIHKAQGATVDKAWVLASGSMDRHLTYVAMTRHRQDVRLYAGRDEFKNETVLSERLSRGGAKETTLDYEKKDIRNSVQENEQRQFAQRRGMDDGLWRDSEIVVPKERVKEPAQGMAKDMTKNMTKEGEPVQKEKGRFDGLKLSVREMSPMKPVHAHFAEAMKARDSLSQFAKPERPERQEQRAPAPSAAARNAQSPEDVLNRAVEHFAIAWNDVHRQQEKGQAVPPQQAQAFEQTRQALDQARPDASKDLMSALKYNPDVRQAMTGRQGYARYEALVDGLKRETAVRQEPELAMVRAQRAYQEGVQRRLPEQSEPEQKQQRDRGWSR